MSIMPTNQEHYLPNDEFIVSKTDIKGNIIYGNKTFIKISGYHESELISKPHSMLRHPDMPKTIFKLLWERLLKGEEIFAYVKNRCKDGSFYWVLANVTVSKNENGDTVDFHSVRRKPSAKAMQVIPNLYSKLLETEKKSGIYASMLILENTLDKMGKSYDDFIFSLQY